jgi:hypothetical protein
LLRLNQTRSTRADEEQHLVAHNVAIKYLTICASSVEKQPRKTPFKAKPEGRHVLSDALTFST